MTCSAIILAAGSSSRMKGTNKQLLEIGGIPVIVRSALNFEKCGAITEIVIAARREDCSVIERLCRENGITKLKMVVAGGATRAESAEAAFRETKGTEYVAVHDGARPFADPDLIERVIEAAAETGAAIASVPVKDTIKESADGYISGTPERAKLRAAQTPQVFSRAVYEKMCAVGDTSVTDDSCLAERLGVKVRLAEGSEKNIKLTTPDDIAAGEAIINGGKTMFRIGHGYDVHRLVEGRRLVLGGKEIPYELGLLGHSDADVLVHAVMDALLGALALGDIGKHFPDNSSEFKDIDSMILLRRVVELISEKGWRVSNLDATVSAEKPKLAPHITDMRENIAGACRIPADRVSVKATTEEGLGLKGEGIGATCVCILERS